MLVFFKSNLKMSSLICGGFNINLLSLDSIDTTLIIAKQFSNVTLPTRIKKE